MDYEKYYNKKPDDSYVLHFPNNKGLKVEEIEKLFSAYGNVLSVDNRGQVNGLCFVKYKTLEEVKRCVDGFKGHKYIRILPQKLKVNNVIPNRKMYNDNNKPKNNSRQKAYCNDEKSQDEENWLQSDYETPLIAPMENTNINNGDVANSEHFSDTSSISSWRSNKFDLLKTALASSPTTNSQLSKHHKLENALVNPLNSFVPICTDELAYKDSNVHENNEVPALISSYREEDMVRLSTSTPNSLSKKHRIIPAQDVIVANVHSNFGVHYILHLLEKYNPIAVSCMKITPMRGIRYCHVYFETEQEALSAKVEFDHYVLNGNNLILGLPQMLAREALEV